MSANQIKQCPGGASHFQDRAGFVREPKFTYQEAYNTMQAYKRITIATMTLGVQTGPPMIKLHSLACQTWRPKQVVKQCTMLFGSDLPIATLASPLVINV